METNSNLSSAIAKFFFFKDQNLTDRIPFLAGAELTRHEVERIAFDAETPENIAENFQRVIKLADNMINGVDKTMRISDTNGGHYNWPAHRILFIVYSDGLKLWID